MKVGISGNVPPIGVRHDYERKIVASTGSFIVNGFQDVQVMRRFYSSLAAIAIGLAPVANGIAQGNDCESSSFTDVTSLSALPINLRTALAVGSPRGKIADVNEPFNSIDVIDGAIPDQRFRSGKLANGCAVISVERGAGHYSRITIIFERNGDSWAERSRIVTPPQWRR